jgi:hypothetical protein
VTAPKVLPFLLFPLILAVTFASQPASAANPKAANHPLCKNISQGRIQASAGAQSFCFGSQPNAPVQKGTRTKASAGTAMFKANVNAASLAEDVSPGGLSDNRKSRLRRRAPTLSRRGMTRPDSFHLVHRL